MEIKHFPFPSQDDKPQLLLKPLDLREWIEIDGDWDRILDLKAKLLKEHHSTVLRLLPEAEAGALELHEVLGRFLAENFPRLYQFADRQISMRGQNFSVPKSGIEALEQITVWTQEDWAILSAQPPVILEAGTVCFPSRWSLADKIGKDSNNIHAPVPRFDGIARPTQNFLERVTVDKPMWRINWTIHDSDQLFCPAPHPSPDDLTELNILDRTWLRIERQTLRRLPRSKAVVFSIRTYVHLICDVVSDPERRRLLREGVRSLPEDTAAYRGMKNFRHLLTTVL